MTKRIIFLLVLLLCSNANAELLTMTVTAITLSANETGGRIEKTAIMTKPVAGWSVAVSRDNLGMLGKKVYIEGVGLRKVDSLTSKHLKNTLDVLVGKKSDAKKLGRKVRRVVVL